MGSAYPSPTPTGTPSASEESFLSPGPDTGALERARTWLNTAVLPEGAVAADADSLGSAFSSYTGWPCGPVATLTAYWRLPDADLAETATWISTHPVPGLMVPFVRDYADVEGEVHIGQIPAQESQEGIVFTIKPAADGDVDIRAEVAALAADATCADPGPGARWGTPGEG
ncbi:hypothetical protein [Microbacterium sp. B19]|uniref:hypothetical protein n=1 Tax=Microbacterium sp. B19 TaxID=96765 RepID=UPI000347F76A|nr:hypothetical protein [Microbacterium sp. B19]